MVASFQYSPISILSVCLPPPILEFCRPGEQSWLRQEASEVRENFKSCSSHFFEKIGYNDNTSILTISFSSY